MSYIPYTEETAMAFRDQDSNDSFFPNSGELLWHFYSGFLYNDYPGLTIEELRAVPFDSRPWDRLWDALWQPSTRGCLGGHDPLRIVYFDYRPFDGCKWFYYSKKRGMISHPRYESFRSMLPWYWWYTLIELQDRMRNMTRAELEHDAATAEEYYFKLPLNARFIANLNVWRMATWTLVLKEYRRDDLPVQQSLF